MQQARRKTVNFTLDPEGDRDLWLWLQSFNGTKRRSIAIREMLRLGLAQDVSAAEVLQAVRDLERKIGRMTLTSVEERRQESPEAAANLDDLGR
jgi:hypothetical protein